MAQWKIAVAVIVFVSSTFAIRSSVVAQTRRHIKVVLDAQQTETRQGEQLQGAGGVIIQRGTAYPSGQITANQRQTTVQRKNAIFTPVLDGSESILTVATRVPQDQVGYYHHYALGIGYIERRLVFDDVGTSLRVYAATLADGQIQLRLTPRISYFSSERAGAIEFTEAATELIVPNGQPVSLGGSSRQMHEVTRRILGYRERTSKSDTDLTVTATLQ